MLLTPRQSTSTGAHYAQSIRHNGRFTCAKIQEGEKTKNKTQGLKCNKRWQTKGRQQRQNQQALTANSQNHKGLSEQEDHTHAHTHKCEKCWKKKNSHKRKRQTWRRTKGKDLRRCSKAEETVRRRWNTLRWSKQWHTWQGVVGGGCTATGFQNKTGNLFKSWQLA